MTAQFCGRIFVFGLHRWVLACAVVAIAPTVASAQHPHNIPHFCAQPTISSTRAGAWDDPNIWSPARVPGASDVVLVRAGTTVTYGTISDAALACLGIEGTLTVRTDTTTRLKVGTIMVMEGGGLEIGRDGDPVQPNVTAEIVIANRPLNTASDPERFGTGLLAFGRVTMHGAIRTPTFVRLAREPRAGHTTLTLAQAVSGWRVGDRIVLPDTRHLNASERFDALRPQFEDLAIAAIAGTQLTLNRALAYDHPGARNAQGVLEYLPHVGNVSRNVIIRSEAPNGTRGHTLYTHRADVDLRYVLFKDLGRTTNAELGAANRMGRYALHLHHVMGPVNPTNTGYQFELVGNAVTDSLKWPLTVHNSHYGRIQDNVVFNGWGAGFVTEDGNESFNEFVHNFGVGIFGDENPRSNDGRDGSIFWFSGFNHVVRDNVAANAINRVQNIVAGSGYNFWVPPAGLSVRIPRRRGADLSVQGQYREVDMLYVPIPEFLRNEAYGATPTGITVWNLGVGSDDSIPMGETVIRDFVGWHLHEEGFFGYPARRMTFDGYIIRGHPQGSDEVSGGRGWYSGDYKNVNVTIRRADIQGMWIGIDVSHATEGVFTVDNSFLSSYSSNIRIPTLATPGTQITPNPRSTVINNVRFSQMPGAGTFITLSRDWLTEQGINAHPTIRDEAFVYAYQGTTTDNFRLYYAQQATQNIAGGRAPCTTRRTAIDGIVCTGSMPPPPTPPPSVGAPSAPANVRIIR